MTPQSCRHFPHPHHHHHVLITLTIASRRSPSPSHCHCPHHRHPRSHRPRHVPITSPSASPSPSPSRCRHTHVTVNSRRHHTHVAINSHRRQLTLPSHSCHHQLTSLSYSCCRHPHLTVRLLTTLTSSCRHQFGPSQLVSPLPAHALVYKTRSGLALSHTPILAVTNVQFMDSTLIDLFKPSSGQDLTKVIDNLNMDFGTLTKVYVDTSMY